MLKRYRHFRKYLTLKAIPYFEKRSWIIIFICNLFNLYSLLDFPITCTDKNMNRYVKYAEVTKCCGERHNLCIYANLHYYTWENSTHKICTLKYKIQIWREIWKLHSQEIWSKQLVVCCLPESKVICRKRTDDIFSACMWISFGGLSSQRALLGIPVPVVKYAYAYVTTLGTRRDLEY